MPFTFAQLGARIGVIFSALVRNGRELITLAWGYACQQWRTVTAILSVAAGVALSMLPYETAWLGAVQQDKSPPVTEIAEWLSKWGDFYPGTLIVAASLGLAGRVSNRSSLQRAALACLLAAALGGLFTDVFRFGLGRARPNSGFADGFYGPTLSSKLHGFPSGHTTSALATGVSLAVALPHIAVPAIALSASVGWSRLYLNYHRPTDVLVGATIGSLFGVAFGVAARKANKPS